MILSRRFNGCVPNNSGQFRALLKKKTKKLLFVKLKIYQGYDCLVNVKNSEVMEC